MSASIITLIEETLNDSRLVGISPNSCFVRNQAAAELEQCGEQALPTIEHAIRERVVPAGQASANHHELLSKHHGLMSLWMTYIAIAGSQHRDRVIQFMRSVDGPVLATAILSLRASWPYDNSLHSEMPTPYVDFVYEVAASRTGNGAKVANTFIGGLTFPDS